MDNMQSDSTRGSPLQWDPLSGVVVAFVAQTGITTALAFISSGTNQQWVLATFILPSFGVTSGVGFHYLVRECRRMEKFLIAIGYFPLMLLGYFWTGLFILISTHGGI